MNTINTRNQIVDLLPTHSIGCELGVFEGDFSASLLDSNKFDKLYLVDLFSGSASNFGKCYSDASVLYDSVKNRFKQNSSITVIKQDSVTFLQTTNTRFNFIYIDTVHTYDHLIKELKAANNCIVPNGYICGHDYCQEFHGVIDAVKEFTQQYNYPLTVTSESQYPSFIIHIKQ